MSDPMVEEFMAELYDKFYPQVMEGAQKMDAGEVEDGIEILSRPLHTIKGVTGFMAGFEDASHFTHRVESYLKKLQSGEVKNEPDNIAPAVQAVNMVFQVIEQLHQSGAMDSAETTDMLAALDAIADAGKSSAPKAEFDVKIEEHAKGMTLRIGYPRLHLTEQRDIVTGILGMRNKGETVILDLRNVLTANSTFFEAVDAFSDDLDIQAFGLSRWCKDVVYFWGFDTSITFLDTEPDNMCH